jgi:threonine synthase
MKIQCFECARELPPSSRAYICPDCGGLLEVEFSASELRANLKRNPLRGPLRVWRYKAFLPVFDPKKIISMGEGGTPLISCDRLAKHLGLDKLFVKFEGANPTGSFKDRGMTLGVTKAIEFGARVVACASTGNTSSSLAAYAARAGLRCLVFLPKGKVALGKLVQTLIFGAEVYAIEGNFDKALELIRRVCEENPQVYLLNSINPFRPQGQKTLGFEIAEQLAYKPPDKLVVPMGNCANIWAIYKGFLEFKAVRLIKSVPAMVGIQAEGAMPIVEAFKKGWNHFEPVENPETVATAIRIGNPVNGVKALRALRESDGIAEAVSDKEILQAQKLVARLEGIGVEPASAASIAGLMKLVRSKEIARDDVVVCVATGHTLKDPEEAISISEPAKTIRGNLRALEGLVR